MAGAQGLEFQLVDVKFTQGLDTRTNKKLVLPGKWESLENLTLTQDFTPKRRDGMVNITVTTGNGLATFNEQLLLISGDTVSTVSSIPTLATVLPAGQYAYAGIEKTSIHRSSGTQTSPDCATGSGLTCYVWEDRNNLVAPLGIKCSVMDELTGAHFLANVDVRVSATAFCPRVVYVTGVAPFAFSAFLIFFIDGTDLVCRAIDTTIQPALTADVVLVSSVNLAGLNFDACAFGPAGIPFAAVTYGWSDGITSVRVLGASWNGVVPALSSGPTAVFLEVDVPIANLKGLAVVNTEQVAPNNVAFIYENSNGVAALAGTAAVGIDTTFTIVVPQNLIDATVPVSANPAHICGCRGSGTDMFVFTDDQGAWATAAFSPLRSIRTDLLANVLASATLTGSSTFTGAGDCSGPKGPFICGKPFIDGAQQSVVLLPVCILESYSGLPATTSSKNQQNSFFLLNGQTAAVEAKALYGTFGCPGINNNPPVVSTPCSIIHLPGNNGFDFGLVATERTILTFEDGINVSPTGLCRLEFLPKTARDGDAPIKTQLGQTTYLAGGALTGFDGVQSTELGFFLFPEGIRVANVAAGGAMTAGVHAVVAIYEWLDEAGNRYQSAPSQAVFATSALNDHLAVTIPTLLLTAKAGVSIVLFMTQAGGTILNRVLLNGASLLPIANTKAAREVTATITQSDAAIAGNELLYTQPLATQTAALPNFSPPPCKALVVHQNRLFIDAGDSPGTFRYSQAYIPNVGLQWSNALSGAVDVSGGDIVGFAELDEKVVILCSRKLFAVFGTGPAESGAFNNYSEPQEIPSDVGCSDVHSILRMPMGVIFKSPKGWYLLDRGLTVKYIGAGIAQWDAATVTSAVMLEDRQECRFTASFTTNSLNTGYAFVYDYMSDQWSVFSQTQQAYAVKDAVWWHATGRYTHASIFDGLNQDTPGAFVDAPGVTSPTSIVTIGRTYWLKLAALANFQRVRWLYLTMTCPTAAPASTFNVSVYFDDTYFGSPGEYNFNVNLGAITFPSTVIDLRHKLLRMKCKSVAFQFTETPSDATNPNTQLSGMQAMGLQIGLKRGTNKLPAGQSVG